MDDPLKMSEAAKGQVRLREPLDGTRIIVAMGDCGKAAGALDTLAAIRDEVRKRGLQDVTVTQSDCIGLCEREPVVEVIKPNQPRVTYGHVTAERACQIVVRHVVNDQVTGEWVVAVR